MIHYRKRSFAMLLAATVLIGATLACSLPGLTEQAQNTWTPAPGQASAGVRGVEAPTAAPQATVAPQATARPAVTVTRAVAVVTRPVSTDVVTAAGQDTATDVPVPTTGGPTKVVITDTDVDTAIASGVTSQEGVQAENLQIHFTGGKVRFTADQLNYGLVRVSNLVMIGRLVAENGQLHVETESVSPGGLVAALLPTVVNQAFQRYASQWYVEDVETREGEIELTVR